MKRPLLLAALVATTGLVGTAAKANTPLNMFNISTPGAGQINFSGTGTANFNQSLGTSNSFNVGSSTNLGVNASASSTEDYTAVGDATLDLAGTSRLQQTIGTATSAFNSATVAEASARSANIAATEVANSSSYGESWSADWNENYVAEEGWVVLTDAQASAAGYGSTGGYFNEKQAKAAADLEYGTEWDGDTTVYADEAAWQAAYDSAYQAEAGSSRIASTEWNSYSESQWQQGWEEQYNSTYTESFNTATVAANQANAQTAKQGTITGSFTTTESGQATAAMESLASSLEQGASQTAFGKVGDTYATRNDATTGGSRDDLANMSEAEWNAAYEQEYQQAFASAYSSASGEIKRESVSNVNVEGIGVIADVNAAATSQFVAQSMLIDGADRDGNGNGNASAGANLATSSYANQNNATTANAFMQAFSGGLPEETGTSTIKKIIGDATNGYAVVTDRVTTVTESTAYTVDNATDGNATQGVTTQLVP